MKQTLMTALAIAYARAQLGGLEGLEDLEYDFNFDLIIGEEDGKMNPLWMWRTKEGPAVNINGYDSMVIPNNQVALLKNTPLDGKIYDYQPVMKGGALQYTVDLSTVDCGCVAGAYAVSIQGGCDPEGASKESPACPSIDIMQANKYGFEMAAHPCKDGNCDAKSKCMYSMNTDGINKYGKGAYGINGSLIDTTRPFDVMTEFISDTKEEKFWKIRTLLTQGTSSTDQKQIVMEADCSEYLESMSDRLNGDDMAFVFSTWESTDEQPIDFECEHCTGQTKECANASTVIQHMKFFQSGHHEDKSTDRILQFQADSDYYGKNSTYYLNGLGGQILETDNRTIHMGENNRAFVLDRAQTDSTYWAYYNNYIGGSVQFDVDVSQVYCDSVTGVYLTKLDDEKCSWDIKKQGVNPECQSIDIMESNLFGFATGAGEDVRERVSGRNSEGRYVYGPSSDPDTIINSQKPYQVKIRFMTDKYQGDLKQIWTYISQEDKAYRMILEDPKLQDFSDALSGQMALSVSSYKAGYNNDVGGPCPPVENPTPKSVISNIVWTENDSIVPMP